MFNLLYRIIEKLENGWNELRWGLQRMFRGYDDRVIWSVGEYLCKMMPKWIKIIKKKKQGIPSTLLPEVKGRDYTREEEYIAEAKFNVVLEDMSDGFEAGTRWLNGDTYSLDFNQYKFQSRKDKKLFENALKLFVKHFLDLRD